MAALIESLAVAGSRLSDGTPNANGYVWVLEPGITGNQALAYRDKDGLIPWTQPIQLDGSGRVEIWVKNAFRLKIENSTRTVTVRDSGRAGTRAAAQVEIENVGYTGEILSGSTAGSQAATGRTNLDTVLTNWFLSIGGLDSKYAESSGATARYLKTRLSETVISVKDFAAKGDDATDDTTAIQTAINRVAALGGGVVFFPKGTYRITAGLTCSTAGVSFRGAGAGASIIKNMSGSATAFTLTGDIGFYFESLRITNNSTSSGRGLLLLGCQQFRVWGLKIDNHADSIEFNDNGAGAGAQCSYGQVENCQFRANAATTGSAIKFAAGTNTRNGNFVFVGCFVGTVDGTSDIVSVAGTFGQITWAFCTTGFGTNGIVIKSACTGQDFLAIGNRFWGQDPDTSAGASAYTYVISLEPSGTVRFQEFANAWVSAQTLNDATNGTGNVWASWHSQRRPYGNQGTQASETHTSSGTFTPNLATGNYFRVVADGAGTTLTIAAPSNATLSQYLNVRITFRIEITGGAPITAIVWNAVYKQLGTVSVTNGNVTHIEFAWDGAKWREVSQTITAA